MVLLMITQVAAEAIRSTCSSVCLRQQDLAQQQLFDRLAKVSTTNPIQHADLIELSQYLQQHGSSDDDIQRNCRLDLLLKGARLYRPPPPPKPEPSPEYKALMKRLREDEERKQYERMTNPGPTTDIFNRRIPSARNAFDPATSHGQASSDEVDEVTYADVNRQLTLIINILISIICCSVAIWIAARRWTVPQRLGLSMSGSGLVAFAEVAIYSGYIRRIKESKAREIKQVEKKEIVESWVIDKSSSSTKAHFDDQLRFRKGKHR